MVIRKKVTSATNNGHELSMDRLTKIDGIARKTAEALYQIGIHSYADLVQYLSQHTTHQVSAALQDHGVDRPPAFINQATWIRQATEFGELENTAPASSEKETEPTEKPEEVPLSRHSQEHDAVFTVSFDMATDGDREPVLRTTVCDSTNGDQEGVFQGNDMAPWVNWMLERAHLPAAVEHIATQAEAVSSPVPLEPGDTLLNITNVQLSVVRSTGDSRKKRLKAEISFQLSGAGAETLASKGSPFRIEGYTVDVESGISELVASDRSQLEPHVFEYVGQQEFGIPDVGRYEFHSIVLLLPPGKVAAYHQGPTMRVVP
jgi:hypothetical protein